MHPKLTDKQIDAAYDYHENGAQKPTGHLIGSTFNRTMGRYFNCDLGRFIYYGK